MKRLLVAFLVVAVVVGIIGYVRGWFVVTNDGRVDVQVDRAKIQADRDAFSKSTSEKAREIDDRLAGLWKKSETLTGDEKVRTQKELEELRRKRDRIEQQLTELNTAAPERFQSLREDLSQSLADVDTRIEELNKKLAKDKGK